MVNLDVGIDVHVFAMVTYLTVLYGILVQVHPFNWHTLQIHVVELRTTLVVVVLGAAPSLK